MTNAMTSGRSATIPVPVNAESSDHNLYADELQCDVGHGRNQTGQRHGEREPAISEAPAHEIAGRYVAVLVADIPEPREGEE
jgi:hypothetical protein